jgi:serine/threonine protein kinase
MIGQIVGNYKILQALGEGGVGMVYKGVDTMLDREVAIKVLRPELASQTSVVERFRSEAVTLAKLSHPNIATLFSLFRHGSDLIMVMEFVRGESLETIVQRRGRLSAEETIPFFCQALDGINHAHEVGIIHRDIKPSNMILTENGTLKVLDFGIARLLGSSRMTRVGNIIGTLEYMSPEQVRGEETDARSDIYALGMMLYELLTGRLPFESENEFVLMKMQTEQMPAPPRSLNPDISPELEAAMMRAVSKNPNERFQNAGEFLQTLLEIDLPLSSVNQFGLASLYQAKLRTRPSKPGIRPTDPISKETSQTAPTNQPTEVFQSVTLTQNETKEFIPVKIEKIENAENATLLFNQNQIAQPPPPEIKQTRLGEAQNQPNAVIKETRLGGNVNQPVYQAEIKQTRLGAVENVQNDYATEKPASFFDRLTWMHYAGAGAGAVILLSVISLAAVIPLFFSNKSEAPAANQPVVREQPKTQTDTAIPAQDTKTDNVSAPPVLPSKTPASQESPQPINLSEVPKSGEVTAKNPPPDVKTDAPSGTKKSPPKETTPPDSASKKQVKPPSPKPKPPSPKPVTGPTPNLTDN